MKKSNGFTLIELIVTIMILGILAGVALPSFQDSLHRNKLVTSANELLKAAKYARAEAVKRNNIVVLCEPTGALGSLAAACNSAAATPAAWTQWGTIAQNADGSATLMQFRDFDGGTKILIQAASNIYFSGNGVATNGAGSVPYTGLVADIYSTHLTADNHFCINMTGGSSLRIFKQTGNCP